MVDFLFRILNLINKKKIYNKIALEKSKAKVNLFSYAKAASKPENLSQRSL